MRRLFLAGMRAYGRRLVLAGVATLIGTAFVAGTLVISDTMRANVERTVVGGASRIDVVVATTNRLTPLTSGDLDRIRAVDGVVSAEGLVMGDVVVLGSNGRPTSEQPVGFSVTTRTDVLAGHAPASDGEVLLAEQTSRALDRPIGSRIEVLDFETGAARQFVVTGLAGVAGQGQLALRGGIGMTVAAAAVTTGQSGFSEIHVRGADPESLRARVGAALGPGPFDVSTGRDHAEAQAASSGLDPAVLGTGLVTFALVALLVAGFVIQNTFKILLDRRTHELALARCMGASRGQVFRAVLAESATVGVIASLLGTATGVAVAYFTLPLIEVGGAALPRSVVTVTPLTLLVSLLAGVVATVAASVGPARAATRVSPVAALRGISAAPVARIASRRVVGGVVLCVLGLLSAVVAVASDGRMYPLGLVGLGGGLFFLGVVLLGPVVVGPIARIVGFPVTRLLGAPGRLAVANAVRNPVRAATTVLALVIGITLTTGVSVITRSLTSSVDEGVSRVVPADYVISPPGSTAASTIPPRVFGALRSAPEVQSVTRVREVSATIGDSPVQLSTIEGTLTPTVAAGSTAPLGPGEVALRPERAAELGAEIGDKIRLTVDGEAIVLTVVRLITGEPVPRIVIGPGWFETLFPDRGDSAVLVGFSSDTSPEQSRAVVERATAQDPTVRIVSTYDVRERVAANLGQATAMVGALQALAMIIALIGVANTLTLSVLERTRESATLRALGMSAGGLRTMLCAEALVFGVVAGLVGTVLGTAFGASAARVINDDVVVDVPWDVIAITVVGAGVATILASLLPSRRATRVAVAVALTDE
ncbi:ABC transporter permease [Pseudonocardia sp. TRM90224]|uniref:ABC transporter permease n=1 Tax=Pseudonocardia sp. TRM90224 TaxID=2812678 RepID=UPI001E46E855|nr:FtsX-like permease family protein [Pseudonocardia sp. TRM90224]